jgi:hypothetical protein
MKMISGMTLITTTFAKRRFHCVLNWLMKEYSVSGAVMFLAPGKKYKGPTKSLKMFTELVTTTVTMAGLSNGRITEKKILSGAAPSMKDASSRSRGIPAMEVLKIIVAKDMNKATSIITIPNMVL